MPRAFMMRPRSGLPVFPTVLPTALLPVLLIGLLLGLGMALVVATRESPEARAERYYQSAQALLEEGDRTRAMLELRNVFDHDGSHLEARNLYAGLLRETGDAEQAYGQYLRLAAQAPGALDTELVLADLAAETRQWDAVARHARAARALAPEAPAAQALTVMLAYRAARQAGDDGAAGAQAAAAEALLETDPNLLAAHRLLADWHLTGAEAEKALPHLDAVLAQRPEALELQMLRLRLLAEANRPEAVAARLRALHARFPDHPEVTRALTDWHLARGETEIAAQFLRARAGPDDGPIAGHLARIALLERTEGPPAARAELDRLAAANAGSDLGHRYALQALARAEDNPQDIAAALTRRIGAIEGVDLRNDARIALARLHLTQGAEDAARAQVAKVLANDPSHVQGLLLRAAWHLRDDDPGTAITDLRTALGQAPRNTEAHLLLAEAHQRLGHMDLAAQHLARAVEASASAPREALAFARFLLARGEVHAAEQVLARSLRLQGDLEVARELGALHLRQSDPGKLTALIARLHAMEQPGATALAHAFETAALFAANRVDESLARLRDADPEGRFAADIEILRVQMLAGRLAAARAQLAHLHGAATSAEETLALRRLEGALLRREGRPDAAMAHDVALLADHPRDTATLQRLHATLLETGQAAAASDLLEGALQSQPEARALVMLKALEYERQSDPEAAIALYERLRARDAGDVEVANNLAGLLASHRPGAEDLARAHRLAGRLTGSPRPEFQDTLGVIALRRGETAAALAHFQAAARGLPDNPTIAFNLALAHAEAGHPALARQELDRGFALAGSREDIPQLTRARALARALARAPDSAPDPTLARTLDPALTEEF